MKIEKFTKNNNGMYLLTLDDGNKVKIHEDLILKYELLLSKQLTPMLLEELEKENKVYDIYNVALRYINTRLRSKKELREYLRKKDFDDITINHVIDMLITQGYLDDVVYANSYVHDKILMTSCGPNKIKDDLKNIGISEEIIENSISCFSEKIEKERIEKLIAKQIKSNHNKGSMLLKRKIQSYLVNLGYSVSLVNQALNGKKLVNEDIYKKEYDKLFIKLSKKYSGRELEYKLKQKMYQKGFSDSNFDE